VGGAQQCAPLAALVDALRDRRPSRLLGEKFADTRIGEHFLTGEA
jgi:hypothetical protein